MAIDLEGRGGPPAIGRFGGTLPESGNGSMHGPAILLPAILQDLQRYAIPRSPLSLIMMISP